MAERLLRRRLGEVAAGVLPPPRAQRVTYEDLRAALMAEYQANGRKCVKAGKNGQPYVCSAPHLDEFFAGYRALDVTTDRIREFIRVQQERGSANGTITGRWP